MRTLYPAIEPYETGFLTTADGQEIYWETSGNPDGKPVVFLHGGPGAGSAPWHRQFFDPAAYRIVLLDQRGCGRSRPHVADGADLSLNTTDHLIDDLEALRELLGIDQWQVFGGSWGSTLSLAYAQRHPNRVTELVLRGIFLLRRAELDWFYNGQTGWAFPDLWEQFLAPVPPADRERDLIEVYRELLNSNDRAVAEAAAIAWTTWEAATLSLLPDEERVRSSADPRYALAFAGLENHYFCHAGFLREGQLLDEASKIEDIPTVIVHGRYDLVCPARNAWDLHKVLPNSTLIIVEDAGHAASEPGIVHHLVETTDRFR
ncbi:prolyl aminopeptidase [Smaragdicoccus niigatensis]|uniref:prolyl aminopeptidase n=1 Tax=Smaragdicoccus niigatensis TaxID=359359 RepID=UPI00037BCF50|nr:prolyl aminopeptidase [Smaragdicoccus niigatensis]